MSDFMLEKENNLDLKNLFFFLLRKWRFLALWTIVFSGLISCITLLNGIRKLSSSSFMEQNRSEASAQWDNYTLSLSNLSTESERLRNRIETDNSYKSASYVMSIDPNAVYKANAIYYLNNIYTDSSGASVENKNTVSLLNSYNAIAMSSNIQSNMLPSQAGKESAIPESLNSLIAIAQDNGGKTLNITVSAANEEDAVAFLEYVDQALNVKTEELVQKLGKHQLSRTVNTPYIIKDDALQKKNTDFINTANSLQQSLNSVQKQLSDLKAPEIKLYSVSFLMTQLIKNLILGVLGGIICSVFFLSAGFLCSDSVHAADEFSRKTGLTLLSSFPRRLSESRFRKLDARIRDYEDGFYGRVPLEQGRLSLKNKLSVLKGAERPLVFLSASEDMEIFSELRETLPDTNHTHFLTPASLERETLNKAKESNAVFIIAARKDLSKYDDIQQLFSLLQLLQIKPDAAVLL